MNQCSLVR